MKGWIESKVVGFLAVMRSRVRTSPGPPFILFTPHDLGQEKGLCKTFLDLTIYLHEIKKSRTNAYRNVLGLPLVA